MKLYVVEYSQGQYGDFSHHVEGIFTDPAKAEGYAAKIRADIAAMKDEECPTSHVNTSIMNEGTLHEHIKWYDRQQMASLFYDVLVTEYESNVELNEYKKEDWI